MSKIEDFLRNGSVFPAHKYRAFIKKFTFVFIFFVFIMFMAKNFLIYVKPDEFAIKQVNIGVNQGIRPIVYNTGLHFIAPFGIHVMHKFSKNIQVFELSNSPETMVKGARFKKAAHIQTSDGFFVDVDVSILYHIVDPYKLIKTVGPGKLYEDNVIISRVEPKLKEALGEMTTEEFYNSPTRVIKSDKAHELLNHELGTKGIMVDQVLIRYFYYSDEIQKNIEEKKLKDQLVFTNQSKAKASAEEALVKKVKEEGEAKLRVKLEEGSAYAIKRTAGKDLYVRTKRAEADLLVKLAEAKRTELINTAYQQKGSDKLIGLKMAEVLKGISMIVLPSGGTTGFNPLDLEQDLKLFGIDQMKP